MATEHQQDRLEEAFDGIEQVILPCIALTLESLLDASQCVGETSPKALATELQTVAAQLEELTQALERRAVHFDQGAYRTAGA